MWSGNFSIKLICSGYYLDATSSQNKLKVAAGGPTRLAELLLALVRRWSVCHCHISRELLEASLMNKALARDAWGLYID